MPEATDAGANAAPASSLESGDQADERVHINEGISPVDADEVAPVVALVDTEHHTATSTQEPMPAGDAPLPVPATSTTADGAKPKDTGNPPIDGK